MLTTDIEDKIIFNSDGDICKLIDIQNMDIQ